MILFEPAAPGRVVAFYSFKGGTGRSMALANVGCLLARQAGTAGPVLMVDWDLEAPGLHRYFRKHFFGAFRGGDEALSQFPGLIDLFSELRDELRDVDSTEPQDLEGATALLARLPLDDYIIETDLPNLRLLKAGRFDRDYAARVGAFDWMELYAKSPFLLRAFAERMASHFRYVLIDSRTGLSDTSGICAMLMPEVLVTVFTPNRQSIGGVIDLVAEAARYRSQSDDIRPLVVYPLPSRIEASEPALRKQWRFGDAKEGIEGYQSAFERAFRDAYGLPACDLEPYFDDIQIQHVPRYAYGEDIAVVIEETRDRFSLTRSYERIAARLHASEPPWVLPVGPEQAEPEPEVTAAPDEDALQDRLTVAFLQSVDARKTACRRMATRLHFFDLAFTSLALVSIVVATLLSLLADTGPDLNVAVAAGTAAIALALGSLIGFARRSTAFAQAVVAVDRELNDFRAHQPPYDSADALQRLRSRVEPLLEFRRADRRQAGKVYVSYRRQDAAGHAGRLYDSLRTRLGNDRALIDVQTLSAGSDFVSQLGAMVGSADVVLAVIGPDWLDAAGPTGRRRLDDPADFVRVELAAALRAHKRVIPVLVGGAHMPPVDALPRDLQALGTRQALHLSDRTWDSDLVTLFAILQG